jgi:hypothetical protein
MAVESWDIATISTRGGSVIGEGRACVCKMEGWKGVFRRRKWVFIGGQPIEPRISQLMMTLAYPTEMRSIHLSCVLQVDPLLR